jgi:methionine-rich copper-binding protein CopC
LSEVVEFPMRKLFITSGAVALAAALAPKALLAEARLVGSMPHADTTVSNPSRIVLTFNEPINPASVRAEVFMTGAPHSSAHKGMVGDDHTHRSWFMQDHAPTKIAIVGTQMRRDGKSIMLRFRRPLVEGRYRVDWSAAGHDNRTVTGRFTFKVN